MQSGNKKFMQTIFEVSIQPAACAKTWTMDWTMDDGRWTMDDGRWTMDDERPSSRF